MLQLAVVQPSSCHLGQCQKTSKKLGEYARWSVGDYCCVRKISNLCNLVIKYPFINRSSCRTIVASSRIGIFSLEKIKLDNLASLQYRVKQHLKSSKILAVLVWSRKIYIGHRKDNFSVIFPMQSSWKLHCTEIYLNETIRKMKIPSFLCKSSLSLSQI